MVAGRPFVSGVELSRALYEEAVRPLLAEVLPGVRHTAARVGAGSDVLGFDTPRSTDHDWGPRLDLFLSPADLAAHGAALRRLLSERLPATVRGYPTHVVRGSDPDDPVTHMAPTTGPVDHRVEIRDTGAWLTGLLGVDASAVEPGVRDWLALPQQRLAEVTGGAVFHDGLGALTAARRRLAWYPDGVWRHLLACQWRRVAQEEAFAGRCAEVGDDLGAAVSAGRLARDLMRLCLLLERRYAPYGKWLGSAFARCAAAARVGPPLRAALAATAQADRERHLCDAAEEVARAQNAAGLAAPVDPVRRRFHTRPYLVPGADRFARALAATVTDPLLRGLPLTGAVDQWADGTDLLLHPAAARAAVDAVLRDAGRRVAPAPPPEAGDGAPVPPARDAAADEAAPGGRGAGTPAPGAADPRTGADAGIEVRPATAGDAAGVAAIDTAFTTTGVVEVRPGPRGLDLVEVPLAAPLHKVFPDEEEGTDPDDPDAARYVAVDAAGRVCGFVDLSHERWNRRLVVAEVAVAPGHRGRGLARRLLEAAAGHGRRLGARTLWLEVSSVNAPAVRAYRRLGFACCGLDTSLYTGTPAEGETAIFMSRDLSAPAGGA
ncbi:GNAT family N-acetyltransferase [Nocardiopsis trehalosi]|uniref:GNAT family N-acetyltransferase n=1 Tax=Nocardiopsis trehalosi TaxID=109329 RepID=UPI000A020FEA|nr:GNAT family N-acetyltransferase [Nocardiopsis trehalosi]